ncbi:HD domain-containing protein [Limosilactobacillus equigenerosi]|uniref:HD superfamily metal-dependent phosphohydrolase n=1 Tax=Limosilactobacillus equigenerosi DSM 18793 = JCM 14505 TaxID=1423742 RepID=A0A0R1UR04_9LACO|nr:HD domain-containing protein [Limosilactobacillus equigenerosi]KRL95633.1 HD superfamily metal-dependent phosphohydrolase [Limosilactobacillus equigenerosi DSM 18793 = JCM 14505]
MKAAKWQQDAQYCALVNDLLQTPEVQRLANYTQHHHSDRLAHSIAVSYDSYRIAKRLHLDYISTARAGLLHDLFYYDWRETKFDLGTHAFIHPRVALRNAEKLTDLNPCEQDIILKHMFGSTLAAPKYWEGLIVSTVDKYEAQREFFIPWRRKLHARRIRRLS